MLTPEELSDRLVAAIDTERLIELVQQVCRIPSVLGEEGELAEFLRDTMRESGFEATALQPVLPDRPNALGELSFGTGQRVVLTGHLDTKPVSHGWTATTPVLRRADRRQHLRARHHGHEGRAGLPDRRDGGAARTAALTLAGTVAMAAVADHMGDQLGSIAYFDSYPADLAVLGELSDNEIFLGHRGRYYFDITVLGTSAHTCHKPLRRQREHARRARDTRTGCLGVHPGPRRLGTGPVRRRRRSWRPAGCTAGCRRADRR